MSGWLIDVRAGVEARLGEFFEEARERLDAIAPASEELVRGVESLTMRGGKRLRPAVLFAAYRSVRPGGVIGDVVDACAGLELLQSYLLIHDDWMDGDDERRGGPSVHVMLREGRGAHVGDALAILAGNLACVWSWQLFGDDPRVRRVVTKMHEEVLIGQQLDLTEARDVSRMQQLKTGSYTLRGPMALGAVLGDATEAQAAALEAFATPLGEAFQMRDDLLGTFGGSARSVTRVIQANRRATTCARGSEPRSSRRQKAPERTWGSCMRFSGTPTRARRPSNRRFCS